VTRPVVFDRRRIQLVRTETGVDVLFIREGWRNWVQVDLDKELREDLIALGKQLAGEEG